jgi:hypothetical protein
MRKKIIVMDASSRLRFMYQSSTEQRQMMVLHRYRHLSDLGLSCARVRHDRVRIHVEALDFPERHQG